MPEQLLSRRCPLCGWAGDDVGICPVCGHGTVKFDVTMAD